MNVTPPPTDPFDSPASNIMEPLLCDIPPLEMPMPPLAPLVDAPVLNVTAPLLLGVIALHTVMSPLADPPLPLSRDTFPPASFALVVPA